MGKRRQAEKENFWELGLLVWRLHFSELAGSSGIGVIRAYGLL
jgi:hypothetical protein